MNSPLIKTPKEILLEKAGMLHFKHGGKTSPEKPMSVEEMKHYIMIAKERVRSNAK
jgi:hypothetical protein